MKKFLTEGSKKGGEKKKTNPLGDDAEEKEDTFLEETGCLMIFSGLAAYEYKVPVEVRALQGVRD
jgi:hypothetical protein